MNSMRVAKDYDILSKLEESRFSSIYKTKSKSDSHNYVLKRIYLDKFSGNYLNDLEKQVKILSQINSQYFTTNKLTFKEQGTLNIIMQFMDDGDLAQKINIHKKQGTKFDEQSIWKVLFHTLLGFQKMHNMQIVHKDFKSKRILFDKKGNIKIDYLSLQKLPINMLLDYQFSVPYYSSPEQWKDKPLSQKSNIWSLGCVIYEMAALEHAFSARYMQQLYLKIEKGKYPQINGYSDQLSAVIKCMLQAKPARRPSTVQLLDMIQPITKQLTFYTNKAISHVPQLSKVQNIQQYIHNSTNLYAKLKQQYNSKILANAKRISSVCKKKQRIQIALIELPQLKNNPSMNIECNRKLQKMQIISKTPSNRLNELRLLGKNPIQHQKQIKALPYLSKGKESIKASAQRQLTVFPKIYN